MKNMISTADAGAWTALKSLVYVVYVKFVQKQLEKILNGTL